MGRYFVTGMLFFAVFSHFQVNLSAQNGEIPLFPFVVSYDSQKNVTNFSKKLDAPAGKNGFVRVKDGRFVTDTGPIRFWGTNLCFTANFPTAEEAEQLSERLARFGFNCVRLHHADTGNNSLVTGKPNSLTEIDAVKLDRLDRLVAELKKRGIYVDINLHVGRWLDERDGFPLRAQRPDYDKGVGNFEPRMIEYQKKYARDLLTHVNPYTKLAYSNDPCVAIVEISNEDSIVVEWTNGNLDMLPEPYCDVFQKLWNDWLRSKYKSDEMMRTAWNCQSIPLGGEMLVGGDFLNDLPLTSGNVSLHTDEKSQTELWIDNQALKIKVSRMGNESWIPQLYFRNGKVKKGTPYTMTLKIRANKETKITAGILMDHAPWESVGARANYTIGPEWQVFSLPFYATVDDNKTRFTLNSLEADVIYEIDLISLRPGGNFGPASDQTLETGNIPLLLAGQSGILPNRYRDFCSFLIDIENDYWGGISDYLKSELQVKSLVIGTQLNYGSTHVQAKLDFCDNHAYWNHPAFPGRAWDMNNWYVRNSALVNHIDNGTLTRLASRRVANLPYTVTEYNHPFPNQFGAEGFPLLAALARFQKWDGIFPFAYAHSSNFKPDKITSFFDMVANVGDLVHAPACYAMFSRGDIAEAKQTFSIGMTENQELDILQEKQSPWQIGWNGLGYDERLALIHAIAIDLTGKTSQNIPEIPKNQKIFENDTNEIRFDMSRNEKGFATVVAPNSMLFTGFVPENTVSFGPWKLDIGNTRLNWCTISAVSFDATGFGTDGKPAKILLAATGDYQNSNMKLQNLGDDKVTLQNQWGDGPVLCEGVAATIQIPVKKEQLKVFALDPSGNRKMELPVEFATDSGHSTFAIGPEYQTLWYEVVIE